MESKNILSPQQQFFNQYRGLSVFYLDMLTKPKTAPFPQIMEGDHVLLRTIDQLTDDEIIVLCILFYGEIRRDKIIAATERYKKNLYNYFLGDINSLTTIIYQTLIRMGILLPFTYLNEQNQPVTLTPDEIISKGWAKTNHQ